jgi:predicted secreted protein
MTELRFSDRRSKRVVFISHCLINVNAKFPGFADIPGAYLDVIIPILQAGVGIFQMPCLECLGWGGVNRDNIVHKLARDKLDQDWIQNYPVLAQQKAAETADAIEDYVKAGYQVLGIVYVDDSPTCGLDNTLTFPDVHFELLDMGVTWDKLDFDYLFYEILPKQMHEAKGVGAFGGALRDEVTRRGLDVPFVPFSPQRDLKKEAARILGALGIDTQTRA